MQAKSAAVPGFARFFSRLVEPAEEDSVSLEAVQEVSRRALESGNEDEVISALETLKNMVLESERVAEFVLETQFIEAFRQRFSLTRRCAAQFFLFLNHMIVVREDVGGDQGLVEAALVCARDNVENPALVRNALYFLALVLWRNSMALSEEQKKVGIEACVKLCTRMNEGMESPNIAEAAFFQSVAEPAVYCLRFLLESSVEIGDMQGIYQMIARNLKCRDVAKCNGVLLECLGIVISRDQGKFFENSAGCEFAPAFCQLLRLNDATAQVHVLLAMKQIGSMNMKYFDPYMNELFERIKPLMTADLMVVKSACEFLMTVAEDQVYHSCILNEFFPIFREISTEGTYDRKGCAVGILAVIIQMGSTHDQTKLIEVPGIIDMLCEFVNSDYEHVERVLGALCCVVDQEIPDVKEIVSQEIPEDALSDLCRSQDITVACNARYLQSKL